MKVNSVNNSISFRQSIVHPSIVNLKKENLAKVTHSFAFGQLYPIDILFCGSPMESLTLRMARCNLWDYLTINDLIPVTKTNIMTFYISKHFEQLGNFLHGRKHPIEDYVINDLDNKSEIDIAFEINNKIAQYNKKHGKKYIN